MSKPKTLTEEQRSTLGLHTPVAKEFSLECGCGEFTHWGIDRAQAESRWADHIAPAVEAIVQPYVDRLAAVEALAEEWEGTVPGRYRAGAARELRAALAAVPSEATS